MLKIFIALSTFNRKKITKLCLENLSKIISDDGNSELLFMMMLPQHMMKNF